MRQNNQPRPLTNTESNLVSGGIGGIAPKVAQAEDKYGNKLSHEDFMDFQVAVAEGQASPHDFTSWARF